MRHLDRPVQLPASASGNRLCRHRNPGGCTRWCSYKMFAKVIAGTILVLGLICAGIWFADEQQRVREVLYGLAIYVTLIVPAIIWANSHERN
ncbi:hypothetical protein [Actinophytocola glycyrrhizae]|uniref:Uncharacterized protein n=1 Tax=Actinophytocola glycyrrhizae TaxID=2044873 RepID=A0ABV9S1Y8_9PSEU